MRYGRFHDPYRGDGFFMSFRTKDGFLLLAVRRRWHFYRITLDFKRRWYLGPFEIEKYLPKTKRHAALASATDAEGVVEHG